MVLYVTQQANLQQTDKLNPLVKIYILTIIRITSKNKCYCRFDRYCHINYIIPPSHSSHISRISSKNFEKKQKTFSETINNFWNKYIKIKNKNLTNLLYKLQYNQNKQFNICWIRLTLMIDIFSYLTTVWSFLSEMTWIKFFRWTELYKLHTFQIKIGKCGWHWLLHLLR